MKIRQKEKVKNAETGKIGRNEAAWRQWEKLCLKMQMCSGRTMSSPDW